MFHHIFLHPKFSNGILTKLIRYVYQSSVQRNYVNSRNVFSLSDIDMFSVSTCCSIDSRNWKVYFMGNNFIEKEIRLQS